MFTDRVDITDEVDKVREVSQLYINGKFVFRINQGIVGVDVVEESGDVVINGCSMIPGRYGVTDDATE